MAEDKRNYKKIGIIVAAVVLVGLVGVYLLFQFSGELRLKHTMVAGDKAYSSVIYKEKEYEYRDNLINILCLGIDKDEEMDERNNHGNSLGQADVIIILSIDVENHDIRLISMPRDTMTLVEMYNEEGVLKGSLDGQVALQYAYGDGQELSATMTSKRVSELMLYLPINGYVALNFESLIAINDAIGGVDITLDEDYTELMDIMLKDSAKFTKGATVHLDGEEALWYIRARDCDEYGSAYARMDRTKQYIMAFVDKAKDVIKEDMSILETLMEELTPYMETSLTKEDVIYLVTEALKCDFSNMSMSTLPGELTHGLYHDEFYLDDEGVAEMVIDLFYEKNRKS